jgi:hypothetical protein
MEILGLVFAAGGFYIFVRNALKELNRDAEESRRRFSASHYRTSIVLMATCPAEQRAQIASWLLQGIIGD